MFEKMTRFYTLSEICSMLEISEDRFFWASEAIYMRSVRLSDTSEPLWSEHEVDRLHEIGNHPTPEFIRALRRVRPSQKSDLSFLAYLSTRAKIVNSQSKIRGSVGCISMQQLLMIWIKQGGKLVGGEILTESKCAKCYIPFQSKFPRGFIIDHIQPVSVGGATNQSNLQLICDPCDKEKSKRDRALSAVFRYGPEIMEEAMKLNGGSRKSSGA